MKQHGPLGRHAFKKLSFAISLLLTMIVGPRITSGQFDDIVAGQLTEATIAVVTISLDEAKTMDRDKVQTLLRAVADEGVDEVMQSFDEAMGEREKFAKLGVANIAIFFDGFNAATGMPRMAVHVRQGTDLVAAARELGDKLNSGEPSSVDTDQRVIYYGVKPNAPAGDAQLARFKELTRATEGSVLRVYFTPSDDQLRVLQELLPNFPPPFDAFNGELLASAAKAGVLAFRNKPAMEVKMLAMGADREASGKLATALEKLEPKLAPFKAMLPPTADLGSLFKRINVADDQPYTQLTLTSADKSLATAFGLLIPPVTAARQAAQRTQDMNTLKQLALAQHNYHDTFKGFAPRYSVDEEGKPLLSWRVELLPFLGQAELYKQFHLDEPWDSEHNRKLIAKMPAVYQSPTAGDVGEGKTVFEAVVSDGALYGERVPPTLRDIKDGSSNTIMLIQAPAHLAVTWTQPADVELDYDKLVAALSQDPGFHAAICDGSVRLFAPDNLQELLKKLLTYDGAEVIQY